MQESAVDGFIAFVGADATTHAAIAMTNRPAVMKLLVVLNCGLLVKKAMILL